MEQREYIKGIPEMVAAHSLSIEQAMSDYDMMDEYYYVLSDEDFDNRWELYLPTYYLWSPWLKCISWNFIK